MSGSFWWDLVIGVAAAILLAWVALVVALIIVRPRGSLLGEALRVLPDALRLIRRLAAGTAHGFAAVVRLAGLTRPTA